MDTEAQHDRTTEPEPPEDRPEEPGAEGGSKSPSADKLRAHRRTTTRRLGTPISTRTPDCARSRQNSPAAGTQNTGRYPAPTQIRDLPAVAGKTNSCPWASRRRTRRGGCRRDRDQSFSRSLPRHAAQRLRRVGGDGNRPTLSTTTVGADHFAHRLCHAAVGASGGAAVARVS